MFRFLFSLAFLKFVLYAVAIYFAWTTLGTGWTVLFAWALASYALFTWGPKGEGHQNGLMMNFATRGNPGMALVAPILLIVAWPLFVIAHLADERGGTQQ